MADDVPTAKTSSGSNQNAISDGINGPPKEPIKAGNKKPTINNIVSSNTANAKVSERIPLSQNEFDKVINLENGKRPNNPSDYLGKEYVNAHEALFKKEGAAFIEFEYKLDNPIYKSLAERKFAGLPKDMKKIVEEYKSSGNDARILNKRLNLGLSDAQIEEVSKGKILFVKVDPDDPRFKFKMPNGNEVGAFRNEWVPGGLTKDGTREIVIEGAGNIIHNNSIDRLKLSFKNSEYL
ncbi:hypothetical protein AB4259_00875 [Vibrio amylolyticus]|uniref:hypothetical protein n=1 Tax=Vibrio amylolyticus TaxID=2847292 RepID=UPI00354E84C1